MDLHLTPGQIRFREEVREFLKDNLTDDMRQRQAMTAAVWPEPSVSVPWQRALNARGWLAPLWPIELGGTGWTGIERFIFETECGLAGAPLVQPMGVRMVGPVLIAYGSDQQKQKYLPRILASEDYWAQGFSEPGAGSDLASLATRAVANGEDFVVNGSKIWTTHAHHANRILMLVRTDTTVRKQDGISMLIADVDTPGIDIRPIISIGGDHDVNQIFFEEVRVPRANLVGELNRGWAYAKYLLEFERGAGLNAGRLRSGLRRIERVQAQRGTVSRGSNREFQQQLARLAIDIDVFEMLELKTLGPLTPGQNPGPVSSILKLQNARLKQAVTELGVAMLGRDAALWPEDATELMDVLVPDYLNARAVSIFGGAKEVQLGIIARSMAGV